MNKGFIYCITCKVNGKMYFGQTKHSIEHRWKGHIKGAFKDLDKYKFHRAIRKYGVDNFTVEEVMWVEAETLEQLKVKLDYLETHFIKRYDTNCNGYNSTDGGDGFINLPEESRKRISEGVSGSKNPWYGHARNKGIPCSEEQKKQISKTMTGVPQPWNSRPRDEETKKKISATLKGWYEETGAKPWNYGTVGLTKGYPKGKKRTAEDAKANSERKKEYFRTHTVWNMGTGNKQADPNYKGRTDLKTREILQFTKEGEFVAEYRSVSVACATNGFYRDGIAKALKGRQEFAYGYIWRYKDEYAENQTATA